MKRLRLFLRCYRDHRRHGSSIGEAWRCGWTFADMVMRYGLWPAGPRVRVIPFDARAILDFAGVPEIVFERPPCEPLSRETLDALNRVSLLNFVHSDRRPCDDARDDQENRDKFGDDANEEGHVRSPFSKVIDDIFGLNPQELVNPLSPGDRGDK